MRALAAASATLETLYLSGAVVLYDVLMFEESEQAFHRVNDLTVNISVDSLTMSADWTRMARLRFPVGLKRVSLRSFHTCVADFGTMCAVTETFTASAASIVSVEMVDIHWRNANESWSLFGARLGRMFVKLANVKLLIHSLYSHNTLGFVCGGLVRLPNLEDLNIAFVDTNVHIVVGRVLSNLKTLLTLTFVLSGNTRVVYGADEALALLAQIPNLSDVALYDYRNETSIRENGNALRALDTALRHRRLFRYRCTPIRSKKQKS
jgi:hypothetical protein